MGIKIIDFCLKGGFDLKDKHYIITYGGKSTEHEISIITALQVFVRAKSELSDAIVSLVYQTLDGEWFMGEELSDLRLYKNFNSKNLKQVTFLDEQPYLYQKKKNKLKELFKVDCVINCFHGGAGEDGRFSGMMESNRIPSTSSYSRALGVCMDKYLTKCVCMTSSVAVIDFFMIDKQEWAKSKEKVIQTLNQFDFPVVVKPASQGSSIGVSLAKSFQDFEKSAELAFKYDDNLIVERAILKKREFNVLALRKSDGKIETRIEEPEARDVIITFSDKYLAGEGDGRSLKNKKGKGITLLGGMATQAKKSELKLKTKERNVLIKNTKLLYNSLNMNGIIRFDYIMDETNGKIYLGEVNAIPGSLGLYFFEPEEKVLKETIEVSCDYWQKQFNKTSINSAPMIFRK